jgi:hypothetical protein
MLMPDDAIVGYHGGASVSSKSIFAARCSLGEIPLSRLTVFGKKTKERERNKSKTVLQQETGIKIDKLFEIKNHDCHA